MLNRRFAIALGYSGPVIKDVKRSWRILNKQLNINYILQHNCVPHITLFSGKVKRDNRKKIFEILKKFKFNKFTLKSPGLGIFANQKPNLFIRWEKHVLMQKYRKIIKKNTSKYFHNKSLYTSDKLWEPRSVIAWNDLKYDHINQAFKAINFLFKKHKVQVNSILLIDYTIKERITHKIKLI